MVEARPLIEFSRVQKFFGDRRILKDISLTIWPGRIFGIIGPSGAGKTTLLRLLIGFYKPTAGKILVMGAEVEQSPVTFFGFGTQDNSFYDELTCMENLEYFGRLYHLPKARILKNAEENLKLVGLEKHKDVIAGNLSGGMKRRLDLAIAIMHDPRILILDEPTAGLDPKLRKQVWQLIQKIKAKGITIIITSHLLTEMEHFCDEVAIISDGKILETGSPAVLKEAYSRNEEVRIETAEGRYDHLYRSLRGMGLPITYARLDGREMILYVPDAEYAIRAILDASKLLGQHLLELDVNRPSLNEVFEALMTQQEQLTLGKPSVIHTDPKWQDELNVVERDVESVFHALWDELKNLFKGPPGVTK